jgi:hypothetical protein
VSTLNCSSSSSSKQHAGGAAPQHQCWHTLVVRAQQGCVCGTSRACMRACHAGIDDRHARTNRHSPPHGCRRPRPQWATTACAPTRPLASRRARSAAGYNLGPRAAARARCGSGDWRPGAACTRARMPTAAPRSWRAWRGPACCYAAATICAAVAGWLWWLLSWTGGCHSP